jgi:hypothetical protein
VLPSSQVSVEVTAPSPQTGSSVQFAAQVAPPSHCSGASMMPLPQIASVRLTWSEYAKLVLPKPLTSM